MYVNQAFCFSHADTISAGTSTTSRSALDVFSSETKINVDSFYALVAANQDTEIVIETLANLIASMGGNAVLTTEFFKSFQSLMLNSTTNPDDQQKALITQHIMNTFLILKSLTSAIVGIENFDTNAELRSNTDLVEFYEIYDQLSADALQISTNPAEAHNYTFSETTRNLLINITVLSIKAGQQYRNGK